jgi:hypothetical protein
MTRHKKESTLKMTDFLKRGHPETVVTTLKDHAAYSSAVRKLDELKAQLKARTAARQALELKCSRQGEDVSRFITGGTAVIRLADEERNALARRVIDAGSVTEKIQAAAKEGAPASGRFADSWKAQLNEDIRNERRAILLLECAIELHNKEIASVKRTAIAEISSNLRPKYETISRRVASALVELGAAIEEERQFTEQLTSQDAGFADVLSPAPLSQIGLLSSPEIVRWIAEAVRHDLIDLAGASALVAPSVAASAIA